ncbi:hypothetical protein [Polycladomyces subterraneus]|uniref:Uncharacterized protein n=1 Tax=Polycladomyces subterraneus TaxID=1016997 RepID=A0ABT8IIG0_9BACL|nr:hypothetical protein [Polycladomyces subterraneus]MDN4592565.1 hypothetical protein [Polycladomyces subterraneus]
MRWPHSLAGIKGVRRITWQEIVDLMTGLAAVLAVLVQVIRLFLDWEQSRKKRR